MPLTMQLLRMGIKQPTPCEGCRKEIDQHEHVIVHWEIAHDPLSKFAVRVVVYPYHESCFYRKVNILKKFEREGKINYLEFTFEDVLQISKDCESIPNAQESVYRRIRK